MGGAFVAAAGHYVQSGSKDLASHAQGRGGGVCKSVYAAAGGDMARCFILSKLMPNIFPRQVGYYTIENWQKSYQS